MLTGSKRAGSRACNASLSRTGIGLCFSLVLAGCTEEGSKPGPTDTTAPSAGAAISFADVASGSVTVRWGEAEDDSSNAKGLRYKLVRAAAASDIDTLEELDAITEGPELVLDYARGITAKSVSGLAPGVSYAFAVSVRDNTGNAALYAPAIVTTLDASAPVPGAGISFRDITETTLSVDWGAASDDVTRGDQLQYKVVLAPTQSAIDTLAEVQAITAAPGLVQDFTESLTSVAVTRLSSSMGYAFAVVVRDEQGNEALYTPEMVATPDVTPPMVGTPIAFSKIAAHGLTINWGLATDAVTGLAGLKYKVVRASDAASIDTLAEVDAISSGDALVTDYASAVVRVAVSGLLSASSYAFAVVVKDAAGNRALYAPATVTTLDESAPLVGSAISVSNVSRTALSLSWGAAADNVTATDALRYKVVKATSAAAIDTLGEVALITGGSDLVQDFTTASLGKNVTGLSSSTSYAFAVVVTDQEGNQAIYAPVTRVTLDDTTPIPGAALSFGNVTTTSLSVNWGKATDNASSQADLQYKLVMADSSASIDTISEVEAIATTPGLVLDYTADAATANVTGLTASTTYAFALLVRDTAGNKALYAPAAISTLDVSAPSPGVAISFTNVTGTQIGVTWGAASDDVTPVLSLVYKVVSGANAAAIDTLAEIDAITAAPNLIADYTANLTTATATGLSSSTSYAFSVVVRDAAGNRALYTPAVRSTLDVTPPVAGAPINFSNVTGISLDVEWGGGTDNVTSPSDLQYKLVRSMDTSSIDTLGEVSAITGADLIQDFTSNLTTVTVTGLSSSTDYAFAVVVRDGAGNQALYAPDAIATLDLSAPTTGLSLSFSAVTTTGMTVSWGAGTDDITDVPDLQYKLVRAASSAAIDSLAEVAAISSGPSLIADFTANLNSAPVSGLTSSTSYAFAVVVRDEAGNQALYAPETQATLDVTPPSAGSGISFAALTSSSVTVDWGAASDETTSTASLEYKLVLAAAATDIDTLAEADAISGPGLVQNFSADLTSLPVAGLSSSTSYAFAVIVRDAAGNKALYTPGTTTTL